MSFRKIVTFCLAFVLLGKLSVALAAEPGGTDLDARLAAQSPDQYAWKLFIWINHQAKSGSAGEPDPAKESIKQYDDDRDTVWETWALESRDGRPEAEVFLAGGAKPGEWAALPRHGNAPKKLDRTGTNLQRQLMRSLRIGAGHSGAQFIMTEPESDEVRINKAGFDFIREQELYSREGQVAAFNAAKSNNNRDAIQFPTASKEVKSRWEPIQEGEKSIYHWRKIGDKIYGLKAFHVITKDLPMWFWADFIHADLEAAEPDPCVDITTRGPNASDGENGIRNETKGSKWENYRLKGTQVSFTDSRGQATILGNQLIEFGNAKISSCMTCHAGAGIDSTAAPNVFDFITGVPPRSTFGDGNTLKVLQLDFLYSVALRAHSHSELAPASLFAGRAEPTEAQPSGKRHTIEGYPKDVAGRLALRKATLAIPPAGNSHGAPRFIVNMLKRWAPGATIKVAFLGGNTELHRKIADASKDWTNACNIKLDFGLNPSSGAYRTWNTGDTQYKADIRIAFNQRGYWSVIGKDSIDRSITGPGEASLNLEGFAEALPTDWRAVTLHELGHAIGFEHEHQSPEGHCDNEFRWDDDPGYVPTRDSFGQFIADAQGRQPGLYTELGGPPNNWTADTVNFNLRQLQNSSAFATSTFDRDSIMKYYFPDWMFKNGTASACYSQSENLVLSPNDVAGALHLYPRQAAEIAKDKRQRAESIEQLRTMNLIPASQLIHLQQ